MDRKAKELDDKELKHELLALFRLQRLSVLSTNAGDQPYASLVAFAAGPDLKCLYFATSRATRKYANLSGNPNAAMLIDNRSNEAADFRQAMAVTASGIVEELGPSSKDAFMENYLAKHPNLLEFLNAPATAAMCLWVRTYYVVSRFQNVIELRVNP